MNFEKLLNGKILDPIHGTIRLTELEIKVINHRLFQRLRTVKQNSFLYKVFPSAVHSRFEHSIGVMHVAYRMLENLIINSYRYDAKYDDDLLYPELDKIPDSFVQELRLAALLHDLGHGPMSHQFDSFLFSKDELQDYLGNEYADVYELINDDEGVEHEHISLIFIKKVIKDLGAENTVCVDNILSLIDTSYGGRNFRIETSCGEHDLHPLLTSLISSSPIDSDRMDYLLRDSYFSGVRSGIYNLERLLSSVIPVKVEDKVCLAYKESSIDSISEFVFSRMNLFSQVYYHKTNRAFSSMLSTACQLIKEKYGDETSSKTFKSTENHKSIESLENFYLDNSDDYFINDTVPRLVEGIPHAEHLINSIVERKPWKKIFEFKHYAPGTIQSAVDKEFVRKLKSDLAKLALNDLKDCEFIVDIATDNAFKDLKKTQVQLLKKSFNGNYELAHISECGEKLDIYQSIRYFVRVFVSPEQALEVKKAAFQQKLSEFTKKTFEEMSKQVK